MFIFELLEKWGTYRYCGIGGKWYDDLTLKYGFKYCSILCSDLVFYENTMADLYNYQAEKIIEKLNGEDWKQKLNDEILQKKRTIKIKTNPVYIFRTKEFYLYNRELLEFLNQVTTLKNLKILDVTGNKFSDISDDICNLRKLRRLSLDNNMLSDFPESVLCLNQLEILYLNSNKIFEIPNRISKLENLKYLNIANNQLTDLPDELAELKKLETLDITDNNFEEIPDVLYKMKNLKVLRLSVTRLLWNNKELKEQIDELREALKETKIY